MATNAAPNMGTTMKSGSRQRDVGCRMRMRGGGDWLIHASPYLPDGRDALAHADAHGRQAVLRVTVLHLAHQRPDQPSSAASERMTQRDRSSVDVDALLVYAEEALARQRLRREGFVQLDHLHVCRLEAGLLQRFQCRGHRPYAHVVGVDTGGGCGDEASKRLEAAALRLFSRHEYESRGAVVQGRRVARGDGPVVRERGPQFRERLQRCVGAWSLVVDQSQGLSFLLWNLDRDYLFRESTRPLRRQRALMTAQRERVLVLSRHLVLLGHALRGLPHLQRAVHRGHPRVDESPPQRGV